MRIKESWEQTNQRVLSLLHLHGYQTRRSFDLLAAREGLQDPSCCPCPHHGTDSCTCQYMVYLIYGQSSEPVSLIVHGHDEWTQISIESGPQDEVQHLHKEVHQLLTGAKLA